MGAALLRPRRLLAAITCLLAAALPCAAAAQGVPSPAPTIRAVELRSDVPLRNADDVRLLIPLQPGELLRESAVRRALRNLQASGLFSEVEVWTRPAGPGEVTVMIALWGNLVVERVALEGDLGLKREALRGEVEQKEGQPLVEDRILRSVYRLLDRLRAEGFLEAQVRARVDRDEARRRARVAFEIDSGDRARVGEVVIEGERGPFTEAQLAAALRSEPGDTHRQSAAREDVERLRRWLHGKGHLQAEVELTGETRRPPAGTVQLVYRVAVGPQIEVEVVGVERDTLARRGLLPFLGEEGYDEVLVLQSVERIRRFYQERGHYAVAVERLEVPRDDGFRLVLRVAPGPLYTLTELRFAGNEEVGSDQLAALMTTTPRRFLQPGSGRLVDEVLASDLENVRSFYALNGWMRVEVGPPEVAVDDESREITLTVPVREGRRSRVVDFTLHGVERLDEGRLRQNLPLTSGGPFHPRLLEETLDRIRSRYEQEGYAAARVSATTDWNPERTLVDVDVQVLEGPRQSAGQLIIRGNQQTRDEVIRQRAGLEPGEALSHRRLLEVQRSLYGLGVFSRVDVAPAPPVETAGPRDVVVRVEESRNQKVSYGVGYDTEEGVGGLFGYSHANLGGRALHLQLALRASETDERYRLLLNQPYRGGRWPGAITYLLFRESEERPSFAVTKRGTQLELSRGREGLRFSLFGDFRKVDLGPGTSSFDLSELPPEERRAFEDIEILSVTPRLVVDRRDDPLDPRTGRLSTAQVQYAFPAGELAEEHFVKLFAQHVEYWPLARAGVMAVSVRAGAIEPLSERVVSVSERFFAGGRTSHRAYDRDRLGIPGETLEEDIPVGGNALLLVNLDYRFSIAGPLGGTAFVDVGNVWAAWADVDPREAKPGMGLGLRYLSPIGPLRVEVGWKLDREPQESPYEVFVSFGNAF